MIRPHAAVPNSRPVHPRGAVAVGRTDSDKLIQVTVVLWPNRLPADHPAQRRADQFSDAWPTDRHPLTRSEFAALYAPPAPALEAVLAEAKKKRIRVVDVSAARHDVILEAPVGVFERAYHLHQHEYDHELGRYRAPDGPIKMPGQLISVVQGVLGMDDIPHGKSHAAPPARGGDSLSLTHLARHYRFPPRVANSGRVAILEFGGGLHLDDLKALRRTAAIRILEIKDGSGHRPGNNPLDRTTMLAIMRAWKRGGSFADLSEQFGSTLMDFLETTEATMDAQIICGLVPDTPVDLVFAHPCADGWRRAIYAEIGFPYPGSVSGARLRNEPPATVMSVSWGLQEAAWGRMKLQVLHGTIRAAGRRGTTVCCSTGDFGSRNSPVPTKQRSVNYPATSPWALACGGTGFARGRREVVWLESFLGSDLAGGGGMSGHFRAPAFQAAVTKPNPGATWIGGYHRSFKGRWIPDVSAHAGYNPGVAIRLLGRPFTGGGTSAATPIWAALVARLAGHLGRPLGWLNPALYVLAGSALRDIRDGHNDLQATRGRPMYYRATKGWDPCTGLGAPDGARLLAALRAGAGRSLRPDSAGRRRRTRDGQ